MHTQLELQMQTGWHVLPPHTELLELQVQMDQPPQPMLPFQWKRSEWGQGVAPI